MSYAFVDDNQEHWPVSWACDALGVSTSGYYSWLARDVGRRADRTELVRHGRV